ncbi:MAG TPA: hypothetical protein VG457_10595 [Planctomycetota bacterium]|jgi:hypothetical protein|nr:hypothetical protein [Planctomycetota bacterium]
MDLYPMLLDATDRMSGTRRRLEGPPSDGDGNLVATWFEAFPGGP